MKKLLAKIIIFFLLGSNVVWAFDVAEQFEEIEAKQQSIASLHDASSDSTTGHDDSSVPCDHCCHGNAHFLGLFSGTTDLSAFIARDAVSFISRNIETTNYQPPTPPPNV